MTLDWVGWLAVLGFGVACVGTVLWIAWAISRAPFVDCICIKCGVTDMDDRGCCLRCGMACELEERKE